MVGASAGLGRVSGDEARRVVQSQLPRALEIRQSLECVVYGTKHSSVNRGMTF